MKSRVINLYMNKNNNPTIIFSGDELFKSFRDEKGDILVDENCGPDLIRDLDKYKTVDNEFELVKSDLICPYCELKLHLHDAYDFMLNNSLSILKTVL